MEVLNMLNTKYLILADEQGNLQVQKNEEAYGNAWFATDIQWVDSADEEIKALDSLSKDSAILRVNNKKLIPTNLATDSLASIRLVDYKANRISYTSDSQTEQLALFSEMYYPYGWVARVNDKEQEILRVNYVLRGLLLPKGKHEIVFSFEPEVVKKGGLYSLIGYLFFIGLLILGWFVRKKHKQISTYKS